MSNSSSGSTVTTSILAIFDELRRNNQVLLEASEEKFLEFIINVTAWRKRWENAELECQRLSIELTKEAQSVANLECKLNRARVMLDKEIATRRGAEYERDELHNHLMLLRKLVLDDKIVGQGTLRKIRDLDKGLPCFSAQVLSPGLYREREAQARTNLTGGSILNVEDLSFDDTVDLCVSRTRAGTLYKDTECEERGKGWSSKRTHGETQTEMVNLEELASPRGGEFKKRRSRSFGFRDPLDNRRVQDEDDIEPSQIEQITPKVTQPMGRKDIDTPRPQSFSTGKDTDIDQTDNQIYASVGAAEHKFVQKTVLRGENCSVCLKRIKFGKIYQKCRGCETNIHTECAERVHPLCEVEGSSTYVDMRSTNDPFSTPSKSGLKKKQIFSSPMLR